MGESGNQEQFDLVVVGGGPSGSTLSTFVAMRGAKVLLLDKEKFPRYQVGESLLPATVNGICALLGVEEEIHNAGFVHKNGGTFRWGTNPTPWQFSFSSARSLAGPTSFAYQVERTKFDNILLQNAKRKGVEVREECSVTKVIEDGDRVVGLRYKEKDGTEHEVYAKFVADASGNTSRINREVGGKRIYSDYFRNVAVFGYFEGGKRMPPPNEGDIFCPTFKDGWFWYIPLSDTLTSVGAVVHKDAASRIQGNPERALLEFIEDAPAIKDLLVDATRITDHELYGQVRVRKDYSYQHTQFWRPGMLLVGDAACFVDPVLSSGVHLATYGGLAGARAVNAALEGKVDEAAAFDEFELRYRMEYRKFYEFLIAFYDINADPESYFWEAKRVTNKDDTALEAFAELVGGASSGELALTEAKSLRSQISDSAQDLSTSIDRLVDEGYETNNALQNSSTVRNLLQVSADVQVRAVLGRSIGKEKPIHEGGLVTSADGLAWVAAA